MVRKAVAHREHDHHQCVHTALAEAERLCRERGLRFTEIRRRIFELVWSSHRPIGAYTLLEQFSLENGRTAPPTVYRALDFLLEQGLIHRVASLNAYVGCTHPADHHTGAFFICSRCGSALELADAGMEQAIGQDADDIGFAVSSAVIEVSGTCARCQAAVHG